MLPLDSRLKQQPPKGVPLPVDPTLLCARSLLVQKLVIRSVTQQVWLEGLIVPCSRLLWTNIALYVALVPDHVAVALVAMLDNLVPR